MAGKSPDLSQMPQPAATENRIAGAGGGSGRPVLPKVSERLGAKPAGFVQKVPDAAYRARQRHSVFQKVDLTAIDFGNMPQYYKTEEQLANINKLLKGNFLTQNLSEHEISKLAGAMRPQNFKQGDLIIKYGDIGQTYYVLATGQVKVLVYQDGTPPNDPEIESKIKFTKIMERGAGFGELALLYNDKRSASIQATCDCETYVLEGTIFKTMIIKSSIQKRAQKAGFLDSIKLFE